MDRILPIDLERAQLRKSFRGYARKEVDTLLLGAAQSMQQLLVENDRLRQDVESLRSEVERNRLVESTLKDALVLAQKAADDTRAAAQKQAENLLEEARQAAVVERGQLQQQLSDLKWEIESVKVERSRFNDEFRMVLERYMRELQPPPSLTVIDGDAAAGA